MSSPPHLDASSASSPPPSRGRERTAAISWKRLDYLAHRWIGIVLGGLVFVWFSSGIVMVFYPWPALTESKRMALLGPFEPGAPLVGFARAAATATSHLERADTAALNQWGPPVGGRLTRLDRRLVYQFWGEGDGRTVPTVLVDAETGGVLSPISPAIAVVAARAVVGSGPGVLEADLLERGDHYMMNHDYAADFPAYRVRFADAERTAVYVGVRGGSPFGVVTTLTRFTTWFGTVPHWFYFMWLYHRRPVWTAVNIATGSCGVLLAVTGIVLGLSQLFRRRSRGKWRPSPYRGISKWHHLAGVVFGFLVLTWTFSSVWENLGESNLPRPGQAGRTRGGAVRWDAIRLSESDAVSKLRLAGSRAIAPVAIDLLQFGGRPGYDVHLQDGREIWVDAASGALSRGLTQVEARDAARAIIGDSVPLLSSERLEAYDFYYYARPGREMHLPAWRVSFGGPSHPTVYLDAVTGSPVGFLNPAARRTRWLRDALHSFDYPALNNRRPLWYVVVFPLLLGGLVSATTGVTLLVRRVRRVTSSTM
jgi:hypothetical protein